MTHKLAMAAVCWLAAAMLPHTWWHQAFLLVAISAVLNSGFVAVDWIASRRRSSLPKAWIEGYCLIGSSLIVKGLILPLSWRELAPLIVATALHALVLVLRPGTRPMNLLQRAKTSNIVRLAKSELRALHYAIAPPRYQPRPGCQTFFLAPDVAQMAWMFVLIGAVESFALHILAASIGGWITLMVVILADVFMIYSVGIARSVGAVPIEVEEDCVWVRVGILFDGQVSKDNLIISAPFVVATSNKKGCLNGALLSSPNIFLRFHRPVEFKVFGIFKKRVDRIKLKLADPDVFAATISGAPIRSAFPSYEAVEAAA